MKATINTKVTAHTGSLSMGTMFIYETFRSGEIVKVNEKSIRVRLDGERRTTNGKTTSETPTDITAIFRFWKHREDNGKALYKHPQFGIITLD
jgi:hypothetical protein